MHTTACARASRCDQVNYYTAARNRTDINVTKVIDVAHYDEAPPSKTGASSLRVSIATGCADVIHTVYGFYKQWLGNGRVSNERVVSSSVT